MYKGFVLGSLTYKSNRRITQASVGVASYRRQMFLSSPFQLRSYATLKDSTR